MIERFCHSGVELALIVRHNYSSDGIEFFTPDDYSQQIGYMKRACGHVIPAHIHNPVSREVHYTREVLIIKTGRIRVDLYTEQHEYLESVILAAGDIVLLAGGGHGIEMLEETEIIEVKQGPYAGDADKTVFKTVDVSEIILNDSRK